MSKKAQGEAKSMRRNVKKVTTFRLQATGEIQIIRREYERPPQQAGFSKQQNVGFAHWAGGAAVCVVNELRRGQWVKSWRLSEPEYVDGHKIICQANVGAGEETLSNVDEVFYFTALPPEIAAMTNDADAMQWLAKWVMDLLRREQEVFQAKANALEAERLTKAPARLPHESPEVDHHKNQQTVSLKLLRQDWPQLSEALDQLRACQTNDEKQRGRAQVVSAYIADYTAICGERPTIREEEEAELWRDDFLIHLLHKALSNPGGRVDKINWQLRAYPIRVRNQLQVVDNQG